MDDVTEMLKNLFKDTLQEILEAEMEQHLGYDKHSSEGINTGNSRNGYSKKTIKTRFGHSEITVPRDRNGGYPPDKPTSGSLSLCSKFPLQLPSDLTVGQ